VAVKPPETGLFFCPATPDEASIVNESDSPNLDIYQVLGLVPYSEPIIHRWIREGTFPPPAETLTGRRKRYWARGQIYDWLVQNEPWIAAKARIVQASKRRLLREMSESA
jgi:predicted DNA-binding transcriptional regulator AlpA